MYEVTFSGLNSKICRSSFSNLSSTQPDPRCWKFLIDDTMLVDLKISNASVFRTAGGSVLNSSSLPRWKLACSDM